MPPRALPQRTQVRLFDDLTEDTFVLLNHEMEYQSKELIALFCDAHDATLAADAPHLTAGAQHLVLTAHLRLVHC